MACETIHLTKNRLLRVDSLNKLIAEVRAGQCIVLPVDTCYILVVDALNEDAVKRLYNLKNRPEKKPIHAIVSSVEQARKIGIMNRKAERLLENLTPGPITLVVKKKDIVPDILAANTGTIGIRIPDSPCLLQFCAQYGRPVTATSANISGEDIISAPEAASRIFGDEIRYCVAVDRFLYDDLSTVIRATGDEIEILRAGAVSKEDVLNAAASGGQPLF